MADWIIAIVLVVMLIETARGLVQWRSGGKKTACIGLGGVIPCLSYLLRNQLAESVNLAFVVLGLGAVWGWFFVLSRRDQAKREKQSA